MSLRERGEVPQSRLQMGGTAWAKARSWKSAEFRGGEGASVPTNTVVLEIVRDEIGRVSWLCSVGSGRGGWGGWD